LCRICWGFLLSGRWYSETTALGAAYAAGLAVGFWSDIGELKQNWSEEKRWLPVMERTDREGRYLGWQKAVQKSFE